MTVFLCAICLVDGQISALKKKKSTSSPLAQTQHRLRWDPEAAQLGHRAEEGGDRHRPQEHAGADGFPGPHQPGHGQNRVPAGCLQPDRVL